VGRCRAICLALGVLPASWLLAATQPLTSLALLLGRRRRRATEALLAARLGVPARSAESRRIVRGAFRNMLLNLVEPVLLERELARGRSLSDFVSVQGGEHLQAALASGRGVIVSTGHIGAWEGLAIVLHQLGKPAWIVTRTSKNARIDALLLRRRLAWARGRLPKKGSALRMARLLRAGEWFGLALDQDAGRQGLPLEFLGATASHHPVAGFMAVHARSLALPVCLLREPGRLRFRLVVEPAIEPDPALGGSLAQVDVTRRLSRALEHRVREHPEQWLWLHDRWRGARRARTAAIPHSGAPARARASRVRMRDAIPAQGV